jgi:chorismate synthase
MQIERDEVQWIAGLRYGRTLGSPLGWLVANRDWENWRERMSVEPIAAERRPAPVARTRPGHADLAGAVKFATDDVRNVLERASARSTATRAVAGAVSRQLLARVGVRIWSFVDQVGPIRAFEGVEDLLTCIPAEWWRSDLAHPSPLRCPDPDVETRMLAEIDAVREAGDSIGGSFVVVAEGLPVGIGSTSEWDTRLDGGIAAAIMSIPGVKGVEIGLGFGVVSRRGSQVHDAVDPDAPGWQRLTNRAGGLEGGMTNGEPLVVRAAVKPVSTLRKPLPTVDLRGEATPGHIERSDVSILPRAGIVGEGMLALVLADELLATFGGDTMGDVQAALRRRRRRSLRPAR